jgi:hypothetical protein
MPSASPSKSIRILVGADEVVKLDRLLLRRMDPNLRPKCSGPSLLGLEPAEADTIVQPVPAVTI